MELRLITAPTAEPVSMSDIQAHLRVGVDGSENAIIAAFLQAAREAVEGYTERALMPQTWQLRLMDFPDGAISIPNPPLVSVTSLAITNTAGAAETINGAEYQVEAPTGPRAWQGAILPAYETEWPDVQPDTLGAVRVTFTAGYANAAAVPAALRAAILLITGDMYENREASTEKALTANPAVRRLLDPFRIMAV